MAVKQAMLMAAGLGTRLKPFTEIEPKALVPVMGVPVVQFAIDSIVASGAEKIVANIHHQASKARSGLEKLDRGSAELIISDESELLLGSAGGLRKALPHFNGDPFFLINADVLCDVDLNELARAHDDLKKRRDVVMTLAVFTEPPTSGKYREIFLDIDTGLVSGFSPDLRSGRPFFIGSAVLEEAALRDVPMHGPSEFVPTILDPMVREKKVGFHLTSGAWKDVGSPGLWLDAHLYLMQALETGRLKRQWRVRLETANRRLANGIWVSRKSRPDVSRWDPPCYFSGDALHAPRELGPQAVVYGHAPGTGLSGGIGMDGFWASG